MREAIRDLWDWNDLPEHAAVCLTTNGQVKANGEAVMGRGTALQAKQRFPGVALDLGELITIHGNRTAVIYDADPGIPALVAVPVKDHWRAPAIPELIERSVRELVALADEHAWQTIWLPRPGAGVGGLDWESTVRPLIAPLLDDRFVAITNQP